MRAPMARPTTRTIRPWIPACREARIICEKTSALRRAGVARNRSITPRSRSVTVASPDHVPAKNAVITTTPGRKKSRYESVPKPPSSVTRVSSWL